MTIMTRNLAFGLLAAALIAFGVTTLLLTRGGEDEAMPETMAGDVAEVIERLDVSDMPAQAEALLATDRPWRAAQVMRRYLEVAVDAPPDHRVLAARAEAGWGAWREAGALLSGVSALDTYDGGIGLYLLGRAHDDAGDAAAAARAYRAFLALGTAAGELEEERSAARLRLGLALLRSGEREAARQELQTVARQVGGGSQQLRLLEADALATTGDTAAVRAAVDGLDSGSEGLRAWRARIAAARRAGDIAGARTLANQARTWARTDATRAEFLVAAATAAIEMGDVAAGRAALRSAIDRAGAGPHGRAAAALLQQGDMSPADHLAVARVLRAQGLHDEAVDGYRRFLAARAGTPEERGAAQMELANALFYAQRYHEVEAALRPVASQTPARMLHARTEAHRDNFDEAVRIYLAIADQHAGNATGAQALMLAAGARHDAGDLRRARVLYERVIARYPGTAQMGLATMRLAGIAFLEGDFAEAGRLWDGYRERYPRGSHVIEAMYWAGRAREAAGDTAGAAPLFRMVRQRERDSYYALLASQRLGQPFWPLPMSATPGDDPAASRRVTAWMRTIDVLRVAGFHDEASAEVDRIVAAAGSDRPALYALAEALAERGYAQRAIRIGLRLRGSDPPNRRLLRILHPFPYRSLITEEARDRGFDPFVAAALIRQESMFEARITSHVGARGLMQIMPATGRRLAEAVGIDVWDAEVLYHPEINVHLGTRYLAQHLENYDGDLPSVFSAYNAGSHRVAMWRNFPEYGHDELFTERIPFRETRDYVRILTRNRAVYQGLYGDE